MKRLYLVVMILIIISITILIGLVIVQTHKLKYSNNQNPISMPIANTPVSFTSATSSYEFKDYALKIEYLNDLYIKEIDAKSVELIKDNYTLKISVNIAGTGFASENNIVEPESIIYKDKNYPRLKITDSQTGGVDFVYIITYPESYMSRFGILISYGFKHGEYSKEIEDKFLYTISSVKFTK